MEKENLPVGRSLDHYTAKWVVREAQENNWVHTQEQIIRLNQSKSFDTKGFSVLIPGLTGLFPGLICGQMFTGISIGLTIYLTWVGLGVPLMYLFLSKRLIKIPTTKKELLTILPDEQRKQLESNWRNTQIEEELNTSLLDFGLKYFGSSSPQVLDAICKSSRKNVGDLVDPESEIHQTIKKLIVVNPKV